MSAMAVTVGTHSGTFQADEALGVWLLRQLPQYATAPLTRSRDQSTLDALTIVIDVGGSYDHGKLRYDHHQRGFFETIDGKVGEAQGPEGATGRFKTKLSASGLVYKHYGREIIKILHPGLESSALEWCYGQHYKTFMEALDAIDNGIEIAPETLYSDGSSLPARVHRLNRPWNAPPDVEQSDENARFEGAVMLCGVEFGDALAHTITVEWPARALVAKALSDCGQVDASMKIISLESGGCPWRTHLYELEKEAGIGDRTKFVLYPDGKGLWRVQAVTVEGTLFQNRLSLPEPWRGLRGSDLDAVAGIEGCGFCHATGFIGGHKTREGALAMARKALL